MKSHLVELGRWSAWRWVRLRGAGFAADRVRSLRSPDAVAAADRVVDGDPDAPEALDEAIEAAAADADRLLSETAADPMFSEAVLWQNRGAFRHALRGLERSRGARRRKKLRAIARYLQRYCTKNDTIGFFGPQGMASIEPSGPTRLDHGDRLIRAERVHFEHWAIDAIAARAAADSAIAVELCPRLPPTLRLEGSELVAATGARHALPSPVAAVLGRCDGATRARAVATDAALAGEVDDAADAYALLESLVESRVLLWDLAVPTGLARPEDWLRERLADLESPAGPYLERLEQLERDRAELAAARGDAARVDAALSALERDFEEATATSAQRRAGQMYAGRTPIWLECLRDADLAVGGEVLDAVAPGLELLMQSARWFTASIGSRVAARAERVFAERGAPELRYLELLDGLERDGGIDADIDAVTAELQARWAAILDLDGAGDADSLAFAIESLAGPVAEAFAAPGPGWPSARYHSPDILIAAPDVAAIAAGRLTPVLGEIHAGVNTCALPVVLDLLDDPEALLRARELDIGRSLAIPVISAERATRADHVWRTHCDYAIEVGATPSWRERSRVLAIADLFVRRGDRGLVVSHRGDRPGGAGALELHLFEVLDNRLTAAMLNRFDWLAPRSYQPRITFGDLVVSRRRWRLDPAAMTARRTPVETFLAVRSLVRELGLPPRVFVKVPEETKPMFADLESPFLVDLIGRLVRGASALVVSEMLPDLDMTWLPAEGVRTATSELRLVVVDPIAWSPDLARLQSA